MAEDNIPPPPPGFRPPQPWEFGGGAPAQNLLICAWRCSIRSQMVTLAGHCHSSPGRFQSERDDRPPSRLLHQSGCGCSAVHGSPERGKPGEPDAPDVFQAPS